jgi:hypothetical protein
MKASDWIILGFCLWVAGVVFVFATSAPCDRRCEVSWYNMNDSCYGYKINIYGNDLESCMYWAKVENDRCMARCEKLACSILNST